MQTVTVTIGRNIGTGAPMSPDAWNAFVAKTREAVEAVTNGELWAKSPTRSEWQGVPEDGFVFYGPVWDELTGGELDYRSDAMDALRATLSILATYYGQDAIGLSIGDSELVESLSSYPGPSPAEVEASPTF